MKAIIYARVSSISNRQNTDRQVADLQQYAINNSYEVAEVFEERISGAKKNAERNVLNDAIEYCKENDIRMILVSELSRLGRSSFEVLETVKRLVDLKINIHLQKEQFRLLDDEGKPAPFCAVMIATLSCCAEIERSNIQFRLNSGRELYKERGGKLGRPAGQKKSREKLQEQYKQPLKLLKEGVSIRRVAKLCDVSISTVQRLKKEFF